MVKIEQRVYGDVANVRNQSGENKRNWGKPFGVHFGPFRHVGPALDGQDPKKSLLIDINVTEEWSRNNHRFAPSDDLVNGSMRTIATFEKLLEADEVAWEAIHHSFDTFRSEKCVERFGYGWRSVSETAATRHNSVVPTDAVRDRIRSFKVGSKAPRCDLVVVLRITPPTEPRFGVRIKEGRSREVGNVWGRENEHPRGSQRGKQTFGPVPVGLGTPESTFLT